MPPTDPTTRFESTEAYYAEYRPGYGERAIDYLAERYDLGPDSRVLDLGCGAGQISVPLAANAGEVVGLDPNERMLEYAREHAAEEGHASVDFRVGSDATLADHASDLDPLALTTMGRSFHWMDQERTLDALHEITQPGGGVALVTDPEWLVRGTKDWQDEVYDTASEFLDDLPERTGPVSYDDDPWDEKLAAHGFEDVETRVFEFQREWRGEEVVGYVLSLSYCSPAEFGDDQADFEEQVRSRLGDLGGPFVQDAAVEVIAGRR